jgi:hypothetical protein
MKKTKPGHEWVEVPDRTYRTGQAGQFFVAAELNRRGAYAVTLAGNMPRVDLLASNMNQTHTVSIQVKSRASGTWQSSTKEIDREPTEDHFWILVDFEKKSLSDLPDYYIIPDKWMRQDIKKHHDAYLKKHGGKRKGGGESDHHSIGVDRIKQWKDRWDILGVF